MNTNEALEVSEENGFYHLLPNSLPEYWPDVEHEADRVEHIEKLRGWGKYRHAYRVYFDREEKIYMVSNWKLETEEDENE